MHNLRAVSVLSVCISMALAGRARAENGSGSNNIVIRIPLAKGCPAAAANSSAQVQVVPEGSADSGGDFITILVPASLTARCVEATGASTDAKEAEAAPPLEKVPVPDTQAKPWMPNVAQMEKTKHEIPTVSWISGGVSLTSLLAGALVWNGANNAASRGDWDTANGRVTATNVLMAASGTALVTGVVAWALNNDVFGRKPAPAQAPAEAHEVTPVPPKSHAMAKAWLPEENTGSDEKQPMPLYQPFASTEY